MSGVTKTAEVPLVEGSVSSIAPHTCQFRSCDESEKILTNAYPDLRPPHDPDVQDLPFLSCSKLRKEVVLQE